MATSTSWSKPKFSGSFSSGKITQQSTRPESTSAAQQIIQSQSTGSAIIKDNPVPTQASSESAKQLDYGTTSNVKSPVVLSEEQKFGSVTGISSIGLSNGKFDPLSYGVVREKSSNVPYELVGQEKGVFETKRVVQPVNERSSQSTVINANPFSGRSGFQVTNKKSEYGKAYTESGKGGGVGFILPEYTGSVRSGGMTQQVVKLTPYTNDIGRQSDYLKASQSFESEYNKAANITVMDKTIFGLGKSPFVVPVRETTGFLGGFVGQAADIARSGKSGNLKAGAVQEFKLVGDVAGVVAVGKALDFTLKPVSTSYSKQSVKFVDNPEYVSVGSGAKTRGENVKTGQFFESEKGTSAAFVSQITKPTDVFVSRYGQEVVGVKSKGGKEKFVLGQKTDVYKVVEDKGSVKYDLVEKNAFFGTGVSNRGKVLTFGFEANQAVGAKSASIVANKGFFGLSKRFGDTTVTRGRPFVVGKEGVLFGGESVTGYTKYVDVFSPSSENVKSGIFAQGRIGSGRAGIDVPSALGEVKLSTNKLYASDPLTATLLSVERQRPKPVRYRGMRETGVSAKGFGEERFSSGKVFDAIPISTFKLATYGKADISPVLSSNVRTSNRVSFGQDAGMLSKSSVVSKNLYKDNSVVLPGLSTSQRSVQKQSVYERSVSRQVAKQSTVERGFAFSQQNVIEPTSRIPVPVVFGLGVNDLGSGSRKKAKTGRRKYSYSVSWDRALTSAFSGRKIKKTSWLKNVKQFSGFESRGVL